MTWDPRADGALCDRCLLSTCRDGVPVRSELHPATVAVVTDSPGPQEIELGRPLVGPDGGELHRALDVAAAPRHAMRWVHAFACRPPGGNLARLRTKIRRANAKLTEGDAAWLDPVVACRPRALNDIAGVDGLIVLGKTAYEAVIPEAIDEDGRPKKAPSIDAVQGALMETACRDYVVRRIVPTVHPSRVRMANRWRIPFRAAILRAWRWFRGTLEWSDPTIIINPPLAWIQEHLLAWAETAEFIVYDTETDNVESCLANLRTIQIGTGDYVVVIAFLSRDGHTTFYDSLERAWLLSWFEHLFQTVPVIGHNAGYYDRQVVERYFVHPPRIVCDSAILHRYVDPDLPHNLGFIGSLYTDVRAWKADHTATEAKTDGELWQYGGMDVSVNWRVAKVLIDRARVLAERARRVGADMRPVGMPPAVIDGAPQIETLVDDPVLVHDHSMQIVCCEMHQIGVRINQSRRAAHEKKLREAKQKWLAKLQELVQAAGVGIETGFDAKGKPLFNPNSTAHMRRLLYDVWDLPFPEYLPKTAFETDSGDRVASDMIMRAYLADMTLSSEQHQIIHAARRAKKMGTLLGRFVSKLAPYEDAQAAQVKKREKAKAKGKQYDEYLAVWPDGRLRVNWNVFMTGVGRLSSGGKPSKINLQTYPGILKDMFEPEEGHCFVGADLSSVHLRIIANLWRIPSLLDDYRNNRDPHVTLAKIIFDGFDQMHGHPCEENNFEYTGDAKACRNVSKSLRYAGAYRAAVPTIHATMTRAEDDDGNLKNRTLTVSQVRAYYERWMGAEPEWQQAWDREIALFRKYKFMLDPLLGRRADFMDGEDPSAIINYRILAAEGALMGPATVRVRNRIPPHSWGKNTGVIAQIHDQIILEVPIDRKEEAMAILTEEMNIEVPGWEIPIAADAKWGMDFTFKSKERKK